MEEQIRVFLQDRLPGCRDLCIEGLGKGSYGASMETFFFSARFEYDLEFQPGTRTPSRSRFRLHTDDGIKVSLEAEARATIYMVLQEGVYSLDDPETLRELEASTMILDQVQRFSCQGEEGVGLIEYFVLGGCSRHPENWPSMR
jgi:hypothetical protein